MAAVATLSPLVTNPTVPASSFKDTLKIGSKVGRFALIEGKVGFTTDEGKTTVCWMAIPSNSKLKSDLNGFVPFVVQDLFLEMLTEVETIGTRTKYNHFKASVFAQLSQASPEYLIDIINTKKFAYIFFENGVVKAIGVHADLVAKMEAENAADEMVIDTGHPQYLHVQESYAMYSMSDSVYKQRLNTCFPMMKI